jgi:hypothetical protein
VVQGHSHHPASNLWPLAGQHTGCARGIAQGVCCRVHHTQEYIRPVPCL